MTHAPARWILEGAGHKADPFEYPINTVQVFRCVPFLGSPFVGVALGLMTINVRTPPVGTIEQTWQFPENFSFARSPASAGSHCHWYYGNSDGPRDDHETITAPHLTGQQLFTIRRDDG